MKGKHAFGLSRLYANIETYCAHMSVNCSNAFVGSRLQQLARNDLLNRQNNTIFTPNANRGATVLYRLDCILDLEISAIWGEN
jgi:hypothetical protein